MTLVTFLYTSAFSLLYLASVLPTSLVYAHLALDFIKKHLSYLAVGGVIYGIAATLLAPFVTGGIELFSYLLSNLMLMIMAIPYAFKEVELQLQGKIPAAIMRELRENFFALILKHEKIIGMLSAAGAFLLFGCMAL